MKRWLTTGLVLASLTPLTQVLPASAYAYSTSWIGNGSRIIGGNFTLDKEICGVANGAPVDGPYVYWVLTASRANNADISIDGAPVTSMLKRGRGSFHYLQDMDSWDQPDTAVATYDSNERRVKLVISHGCTQGGGAG